MPAKTQQVAVQRIVVAAVERLKRRNVSVAIAQHQGAVFGRFVHRASIGALAISGKHQGRGGQGLCIG